MSDEFIDNQYTNDIGVNNDVESAGSNYATTGNTLPPEIPDPPDNSDNSAKPKKVAKVTSVSLVSMSAILVVVGGGSSLITNSGGSDSSKAVLSLEATNKVIYYNVEISNNSNADKTIHLENTFTDRTVKVKLENPEIDSEGNELYYFFGEFVNLVPSSTYKVSIKAGSTTLDSKEITMKSQSDYPIPELVEVNYEIKEDSLYFTFTVDYDHVWTNYIAEVEFGENILQYPIENDQQEYSCDLSDMITENGIFRIKCDSYEQLDDGTYPYEAITKTIYETEFIKEGEIYVSN